MRLFALVVNLPERLREEVAVDNLREARRALLAGLFEKLFHRHGAQGGERVHAHGSGEF